MFTMVVSPISFVNAFTQGSLHKYISGQPVGALHLLPQVIDNINDIYLFKLNLIGDNILLSSISILTS